MQKNDFWFSFGCKVGPAWNETRTRSVAAPSIYIYIYYIYIYICFKSMYQNMQQKSRKTSKSPKRVKVIAQIKKKIRFFQKRKLCREVFSFNVISQSMLEKSPENSNGRTEGQTDVLKETCDGPNSYLTLSAYKWIAGIVLLCLETANGTEVQNEIRSRQGSS